VLLAALSSALRKFSPSLQHSDIQVAAPVDARPYLGNQSDFVLSISSSRAASPHTEPDLWANARVIRSELAPFLSIDAIEEAFNRVEAALALKLEPSALVERIIQNFGHHVLLSNLKHADFPPPPQWPSSPCGLGTLGLIGR
jgi:hypothetical protein